MSSNLKIELTAEGDNISAISEAHSLVKAVGRKLYLSFRDHGFKLRISPESYVQDLIDKYQLEKELESKE